MPKWLKLLPEVEVRKQRHVKTQLQYQYGILG